MSDRRLPEVLEEFELEIEKLVAGGDGLGRVGRFPIFVARAAPGDRLRVRLWQRKPDFGRAEILEVLRPGPHRRSPPCPHFSDCGGCDLQHLEDAAQVEAKVAATRETLERLGGVEWPSRVEVVTGDPWAYRTRARLRLEAGEGERPRVGYLARGSHRLVEVSRCPILVPELEALLPQIAAAAGSPPPSKVEVAAGEEGTTTVSPPLPGIGRGAVRRTVGEFAYRYDARAFFQGHAGLLPRLVEVAVGGWEGETAFDLYAGVGLFGLPLARRYRTVVAVESDKTAVRYQRRNVVKNGVTNLEIVPQAAESWIRGLPADADRVLVDPPRIGLPVPVREQLLRKLPRRLTYVSCHPGTLARDLRWLLRGYSLDDLTLVDLFPQTGHMEAVAQLRAAGRADGGAQPARR